MRSRYKTVENEFEYFITSTIVNWIPLFREDKYCNILLDAVKYNQVRKDLKIFAYVIMPDHFHMIAQSVQLSCIMRSIKSYSAKRIIEELKNDRKSNLLKKFIINKLHYKTKTMHQIWQQGFHPQIISNDKIFGQKIDYIHMNPVEKGLVDSPEKWKYSSYSYYYLDKECDIDIFNYD